MSDVKKHRRIDAWTFVSWGTVILFAVFLLYPVINMLTQSVVDDKTGAFTLAYFRKFFKKKYYYSTLFNSLKVTGCTTVLAAALGTTLAYLLRTVRIRGKGVLEILIILTLMSPPFIGAYSWVLLAGRSGVISQLLNQIFGIQYDGIYGFPGILLVLTLKLFPLVYLYVSGALKNMDNSINEAAESMGCTGVARIFKVVLPLILPTLLAGALMVFMRAFADFGTPMLIGEGYRTIPVVIYTEFISEMGGDDGFAAALSVMSIAMTLIVFLAQKFISRRKAYAMNSINRIKPVQLRGWKNVIAHAFCYFMVFMGFIPQIVVTYTSFLKTTGWVFSGGYSLENYQKVFAKMSTPIRNTYVFALIALVIMIILGVMISYLTVRRRNVLNNTIDIIAMIPYIIPGSVLGIALLMSFNSGPLVLSGTAAIIILAYVIRRLSYTVRSSAAILLQIPVSTEEAAISMGATQMKTFAAVTLPIMLPGVISGAILSWMTSITELSSSIMLYSGRTNTMTISIYTEVIRGNYGNAAALSAILTATAVLSLLLMFRLTGKREIEL